MSNGFLDSPSFRKITTPTQRERVETRRGSSGRRGSGRRDDPVRRETSQEAQERQQEQKTNFQDNLRRIQQEFARTGDRISQSEAEAILRGETPQSVVDRANKSIRSTPAQRFVETGEQRIAVSDRFAQKLEKQIDTGRFQRAQEFVQADRVQREARSKGGGGFSLDRGVNLFSPDPEAPTMGFSAPARRDLTQPLIFDRKEPSAAQQFTRGFLSRVESPVRTGFESFSPADPKPTPTRGIAPMNRDISIAGGAGELAGLASLRPAGKLAAVGFRGVTNFIGRTPGQAGTRGIAKFGLGRPVAAKATQLTAGGFLGGFTTAMVVDEAIQRPERIPDISAQALLVGSGFVRGTTGGKGTGIRIRQGETITTGRPTQTAGSIKASVISETPLQVDAFGVTQTPGTRLTALNIFGTRIRTTDPFRFSGSMVGSDRIPLGGGKQVTLTRDQAVKGLINPDGTVDLFGGKTAFISRPVATQKFIQDETGDSVIRQTTQFGEVTKTFIPGRFRISTGFSQDLAASETVSPVSIRVLQTPNIGFFEFRPQIPRTVTQVTGRPLAKTVVRTPFAPENIQTTKLFADPTGGLATTLRTPSLRAVARSTITSKKNPFSTDVTPSFSALGRSARIASTPSRFSFTPVIDVGFRSSTSSSSKSSLTFKGVTDNLFRTGTTDDLRIATDVTRKQITDTDVRLTTATTTTGLTTGFTPTPPPPTIIDPPPPPNINIPAFFPPGGGLGGGGRRGGKRKQRGFGFTPSITGATLGIKQTGTKATTGFTGLELRGI